MITALDRARRVRGGDDEDGGFALLFVLFVSTMVMIGTAAMLSVVSGNARPARASQDNYAALAAAHSGVQDYLAQLDAHCRTVSIQSCQWLRDNPTLDGAVGEQTYLVTALNPTRYLDANGGTLRVVSTGRAGGTNGSVKTLTADLSGRPSVLRFTYLSNYETLGTSFLRSYYGARTITLNDSTVASAVGLPTNSLVHWDGTGNAPANGFTDTVCDALYYDDATNPAALSGQGRAKIAAGRSGLASGTNFSEDGYTREATLGVVLPTAPRVGVTRDAPCEVRFSKGMRFTGPVYSRDALFVTNGEVGSSSGPAFVVPTAEPLPPASTGWSAASVPAVPNVTAPYRADPVLGGTPTSTGSLQPVSTFSQRLTLPAAADPKADCVYTGPTRIVLLGGVATVTSPLTTASTGSSCYQSTGSGSGVVEAKVPVASTIIKVVNASTSISGNAPNFPGLPLGAGSDITTYSTSLGDAYVQGSLTTGKLSLVAANDIVVTGDLTTDKTVGTNSAGENSWTGGAAIDLVANKDVRVYHPVRCASGTATDGYCPNDISGLYSNAESKLVANNDGTLKSTHPSRQYANVKYSINATTGAHTVASGAATSNRRIDAAVLALGGSFRVDNFNRGDSLAALTVTGGVYMNHRGAVGQLWEIPTTAVSGTRPSSGYTLQIDYLSYATAGLPYVPILDNGAGAASPWTVLNVSTGGAR